MAFKQIINSCLRGNFNTPQLNAIKRTVFAKEWGSEAELGSWKKVLDTHGPNVAYAALRQGTLPYIPHTLLRDGHGVKWPESHEFIMKRQFWRETWREEFRLESDTDHAHTKKEIDAWLTSNKVQQDDHQQFDELLASAKTGIPHGIEMPLPTPTATVKMEEQPGIQPQQDSCGPKYDELHSHVVNA